MPNSTGVQIVVTAFADSECQDARLADMAIGCVAKDAAPGEKLLVPDNSVLT